MIELIWDKGFKKTYKKRITYDHVLKSKFWEAINLFSENPFNRSLRTHKLTGNLVDSWAFSVDYDCRVIFKFLSEDKVLLIDIGSHDEVY
ncbi:MAG: type II toxin-antitoxin system mRNA interferase toxin, RelE/StbE family [Candidatus Eremiobacterota bacterium]